MFCLFSVKYVFPSATTFSCVLEEDGSMVSDEVLDDIIESRENIGTLMILQNTEAWRKSE